MLQNSPEIKAKINQLWDAFWSGGITNPLAAIEQITYLLFMKRLDELDAKRQADAEILHQTYVSRFSGVWVPPEHRGKPAKERKNFAVDRKTLRWRHFSRMPGDKMPEHIRTKVFPFLQDMAGEDSEFTRHMQNAVFIIPSGNLLLQATRIIDGIFALMEQDAGAGKGHTFQDIQGDVYEYLLSEIASSGKNGQFRTPRHIIKLMVELAQPRLGQRILDPACGTGGFLLGAFQYIVTQQVLQSAAKQGKPTAPDEDGFLRTSLAAFHDPEEQAVLNSSLFGFDIDGTMVRLGLMNLMMHGIDAPQISYQDTLSKSFTEEAAYDIVLANPPFTGSIDKSGLNEGLALNTAKTELLFVENICRLLKKGGTGCVIVPQGVLYGSSKACKALREMLVARCCLHAVITMPGGVFRPYAGVSTAVLLFTKVWGPEEKTVKPATEYVWFYEMASDGYSLDDKRRKQEGYGDLQDIIRAYRSRNPEEPGGRSGKYFMVPRAELADQGYDLSFNRYYDPPVEEVEYEEPEEILAKLLELEVGNTDEEALRGIAGGIVRELLELKRMIG